MIAEASRCMSHVQTRTQSSLIHSRKGIWKANCRVQRRLGRRRLSFSLPLKRMHGELTKSFPLITARRLSHVSKPSDGHDQS